MLNEDVADWYEQDRNSQYFIILLDNSNYY